MLTQTNPKLLSISILLLRLLFGGMLFIAGAGKLYGWFGGFGIEATLEAFAGMGFGAFWTYVSCYAEFLAGGLMVLGLLTRPAAFVLTINMLVATYVVWPMGFMTPNGAAYPFTFLIGILAVLLSGPLAYSLDAVVFKRK